LTGVSEDHTASIIRAMREETTQISCKNSSGIDHVKNIKELEKKAVSFYSDLNCVEPLKETVAHHRPYF
jgi:hypothetical protein